MKRVALIAVLALGLGGCQGLIIPASLVAGAAVGASVMGGLQSGVATVDEVKKDIGPPADCDTLDVLAQKFWGCYQPVAAPPPPPMKPKRHHHKKHKQPIVVHSGEGGDGCCGASFGVDKFPRPVTLIPLPMIMLLDGRKEVPDRATADLVMAHPITDEPKPLDTRCLSGCAIAHACPHGCITSIDRDEFFERKAYLEDQHRRWMVFQGVGLIAAFLVGVMLALLVRRDGRPEPPES